MTFEEDVQDLDRYHGGTRSREELAKGLVGLELMSTRWGPDPALKRYRHLLDCWCSRCGSNAAIASVLDTPAGEIFVGTELADWGTEEAMRQAKAHLGRHVPYGDLLVVVSLRWKDDPERPRTRCTKCGPIDVDRADLLGALADRRRNLTVG